MLGRVVWKASCYLLSSLHKTRPPRGSPGEISRQLLGLELRHSPRLRSEADNRPRRGQRWQRARTESPNYIERQSHHSRPSSPFASQIFSSLTGQICHSLGNKPLLLERLITRILITKTWMPTTAEYVPVGLSSGNDLPLSPWPPRRLPEDNWHSRLHTQTDTKHPLSCHPASPIHKIFSSRH